MTLTWRREDSGYFAAAVAAAAVIAYVLIGNFGLLPSPFAAPASTPTVLAAIEPVLNAVAPEVEVSPVRAPERPAPVVPPVAPQASGDRTAPTVAMRTPSGTSFTLAQPAFVEGSAADAGSGISGVQVAFTPAGGSTQTVTADVTCDTGERHTCFWRAEVPAVVASYAVKAKAVDAAGNDSSWTSPIEVTVVNAGGAVSQVTDTVARVPSALGKAVNGLLNGLTSIL